MPRRKQFIGLWLLGAMMLAGPVPALAHGGEDHSSPPAVAAPAGAGVTTRTARAGDYEITLKQPPLTPDQETAISLFVTRYTTNEAVAQAAVRLTLRGADGKPTEITPRAGIMPGAFTAKLPPLPAGAVQVTARLSGVDTDSTADFGSWPVAAPASVTPPDASVWARNLLIVLGLLAGLGLATWLVRRLAVKPRPLSGNKEEAAA